MIDVALSFGFDVMLPHLEIIFFVFVLYVILLLIMHPVIIAMTLPLVGPLIGK